MLRRLHISIYFLIFAALMMLHGCDKCELASGEKDASLQIRLNAPSYVAELKSVSSDPDSPENWSKWERAVDGRFMYRVTAFLLQGNRLVAHKDLTLDGEPDQATIDFEANFTHGAYTLMVVANYSAFEAEDGNVTMHYNGITGFAGTVDEILTHNTIDNFTNTYADSFMNFQIESMNGVCRRVPQPLTLVKEIELHPGTNVITGELIRTYSRVRIAVENNSDEELMLSSLDFADIFTQSKAYLFEGKGYLNTKTNIDVTSSNAMTPFTGSESDPMIVPPQGMSVIFDAYILESSKGSSSEAYTYSLGIGYNQLNSYILKSATAIKRKANVTTGRYLMYNRGTGTYLRANSTTSVSTGNPGTLKAGMSIPKEYVWSIDNTGLAANRYYIGTSEALDEGQTAYYMYISRPSNNNSAVQLGATPSYYFTVADTGSGTNQYITFQSSGTGSYRFLGTNNNNVVGQRSSNSSHFLLYPVDIPTSSYVDIPVKTINQDTGQAEDVSQINRNDFINAVVKVSYSKNQGHFIYEVKDWSTGGGDVNFN